MPSNTNYYNLEVYSNASEDEATSFYNYRIAQSGPSNSNMTKIDDALHAHDGTLTSLLSTRGAITVSATYVSPGYYEATVSIISTYVADMPIILKLDATSLGTTTLKINALATKTLVKIGAAGTITNLTGNDLVAGRYYLFRFDSVADAWIWVNQQTIQENGWVDPGETWTYASASTFTIAGDQTTKYKIGVKIKLTQSASVKYFYVVSSSYGAPNTTVTITGGSDYSLENAAITSPFYSRVANPQGFPQGFAWTPTLASLTVVGTPTYTGFFTITENLLKFIATITSTTSTASAAGVTNINNLPISALRTDVIYVTSNFVENTGLGMVTSNTAFLPAWSASGHQFFVSGTYTIV